MIIEVNGLTKFYGAKVGVKDLNFAVDEGESFGFLGPNGAGKTTTIRMLLGFIQSTTGQATILGLDAWRDSVAIREMVGFIPGEIRLYENMTCAELLIFIGRFRAKFEVKRMHLLAERFELDLRRKVKGLSKGMKQKVGIIQGLMHDAPLLVFDEPSSGLDPLMQVEFIEVLREQKAAGKTIFLSSHVLPEVEKVCDRVGIVRDGNLVAIESVESLKTKRVRRMDVTFAGTVDKSLFNLPGVTVLSGNGTQFQIGVRGEISPILKVLGGQQVVDMTFGAPDLEEIFLHYYGQHNHVAVPSGKTEGGLA